MTDAKKEILLTDEGAIGTDIALVQLSGIAQKVKFNALKRRAGEAMERIAQERKMTRDELEDRIVPDGGFGPDGKRVFSFGTRNSSSSSERRSTDTSSTRSSFTRRGRPRARSSSRMTILQRRGVLRSVVRRRRHPLPLHRRGARRLNA